MPDPDETPRVRAMPRADAFHRFVVHSIDWNPTCLPGTEQVTIVRQIVQQADERRCARHEAEMDRWQRDARKWVRKVSALEALVAPPAQEAAHDLAVEIAAAALRKEPS